MARTTFPPEVKDIPGSYRIIGKPKNGKKWRVLHTQGDEMCFFSKMYWYQREHSEAQFKELKPKEKFSPLN